ncbi:MAG: hypothetical protein IPL35_09295 [Sphingobacteriales bacterium]|nr:hypothetical protein [Sphingobacteriales bacterium]
MYRYHAAHHRHDTLFLRNFGYDPQWGAKVEDETFAPTDSVYILPADSLPPQLRISMPPAIGEEIKDPHNTPGNFESRPLLKMLFMVFILLATPLKEIVTRMLRGTSRLSVLLQRASERYHHQQQVHHFL